MDEYYVAGHILEALPINNRQTQKTMNFLMVTDHSKSPKRRQLFNIYLPDFRIAA
jgi:hypothetical protein